VSVYSADVDSHSSAAVDWHRFYLTLAQRLYLLFINKVVYCDLNTANSDSNPNISRHTSNLYSSAARSSAPIIMQ